MTELADRLEGIVRAVPGVVTLFSVEPALVTSVKEIRGRTGSLVSIADAPDEPVITVSVGVDASVGAPVTAATIAEAIRAALPVDSVAEIVVRISRVG